jgi:predicted dehydrogenase
VERIGTALIGLGKIATAHAEALASLPRSRFLAVFDNDPGRAHAFGERYGVRVCSRIHVHGATGASIGVQTETGSSFIAGVTTEIEPPINDIWTIVGEEHLLSRWQREDRDRASRFDIATHYHRAQIEDFLDAICEARLPLVPGEEGRKSVEIAAAIYKSQAKRAPVRFPVARGADGPTRTAVMA